MKQIKMTKTVGDRKAGKTYEVTTKTAELYIRDGVATKPGVKKEEKEVIETKEEKEAVETKEKKVIKAPK